MATKKPALIVDVLAGPPGEDDGAAPPFSEEEEEEAPREDPAAILADIEAKVAQLRGLMPELH